MKKHWMWRWVYRPGTNERLYSVGMYDDGSLRNPNGYPQDLVREAVLTADAKRKQEIRERRREGANRAAVTRAKRRELKVAEVAERARQGSGVGARKTCYICGKYLTDPPSIARGIGPECRQDILAYIEAAKTGDDPRLSALRAMG
jgi:hypothetical protein